MKLYTFVSLIVFFNFSYWGQLNRLSEPKRLPIKINSSAEESAPILSSSGKELFFTRTFDQENQGGVNDQDIWTSIKNEKGEWSQCENVSDFNNELHNGLLSFSNDGKIAYLLNSYGGKTKQLKGIAYSTQDQNGNWKKPDPLELNLNDFESSSFGFSISADQKIIVISAKMKNSGSGLDLFLSEKSSGLWSKPERLTINTTKNEISPFLSENGDTLYFSSNGLEGLGNYDLFYSTRNGGSMNWNNPKNMGNVINSPDFDAYLFRKENQYFWSSNRGSKDADIYFAEEKPVPTLSVNVAKKDISKFNGSDGEIDLTIASGTAPYKFKWSNGGFVEDQFKLRKGLYEVEITDAAGQRLTKTIELVEPKPELRTYFRLPEVRFEFDSWNLSSTKDFDSLNLIADLLNKNPGVIIELISHTDSRGDEKSNMKLSENRAKAVYTYLVEKQGIDPRRMIPIGKGETEPVRYIDPSTNQYITLTETYIETFKNTDLNMFEQLHQQNRRLEGRIISFDFNPKTAPAAPKEYLLQPK
ncbi:MAG: OmpA family protein [Bacteroidetes bacterium]|nr:OmpA family protein [Bacteroidota bacterium]